MDKKGNGNIGRHGEVNLKRRFGRTEDIIGNAHSRGQPLQAHQRQALDQLDAEIYSLGGTDEDLKLVREAESGSEIDGSMPSKKNTGDTLSEKDIMGMVRQLGLDQVNGKDLTFPDSDEGGMEAEEEKTLISPSVSPESHKGSSSVNLGFEKSSQKLGANKLVRSSELLCMENLAHVLPGIPNYLRLACYQTTRYC